MAIVEYNVKRISLLYVNACRARAFDRSSCFVLQSFCSSMKALLHILHEAFNSGFDNKYKNFDISAFYKNAFRCLVFYIKQDDF